MSAELKCELGCPIYFYCSYCADLDVIVICYVISVKWQKIVHANANQCSTLVTFYHKISTPQSCAYIAGQQSITHGS